MNFTLDEVLDLELSRIEWFSEKLEERRQAESKAMKDAARK